MPSSRYRQKNAPSTSSREKPQVIWVRSLVPKEKNSADLAISPAVSAARGSSIMVPISGVHVDAGLLLDLGQHLGSVASRAISSSCTDAISGIMISGCGSLARLLPLGGRVRDRPDLHGEQAGDDQAEPDAAQAEHRVLLVQPADRLQQPQVLLGGLVPGQRDLDRQLGEVGQELVQRRVDQPDGDRQPVHRLEDLDEVAALQRLERVQRGLPGRRRPRPGSGRSTSWRRSPRNMCSVRHRPTPPAPNRRARAQSRRCRRWRARRGGAARRRAS